MGSMIPTDVLHAGCHALVQQTQPSQVQPSPSPATMMPAPYPVQMQNGMAFMQVPFSMAMGNSQGALMPFQNNIPVGGQQQVGTAVRKTRLEFGSLLGGGA